MLEKNSSIFSCHFEEKLIFSSLTRVLYNEIPGDREPAFLCIGIDRCTGDCFGPLTGTLLQQHLVPNIYGTLQNPVHAKNITQISQQIPRDNFVVAVDACLGSAGNLGNIVVKKSPIYPGKAMEKVLPPVGDLSVVLNVNIAGIANYMLLQNSSLYMVWKGASVLARSISTALYMRKKNNFPPKSSHCPPDHPRDFISKDKTFI